MMDGSLGGYSINEKRHVVLDDGTELNMGIQEYDLMRIIQNRSLEILLVIDDICRRNEITYYLVEGSLLGAVRHHGFIPWDDDIDIAMMRPDYDRFLEVAPAQLPEDMVLDCFATNPSHWTILSEVESLRPSPVVKKRLEGIALSTGADVDIFPLDLSPEGGGKELARRGKEIYAFRRAMWLKSGLHTRAVYDTLPKRILRYYPSKMRCRNRSLRELGDNCEALMRKFNQDDSCSYVTMFASLYSALKETFPRDFFGTPVLMEFEGHMLPVPMKTEEVLSQVYGDYLSLPSLTSRRTKHHFQINEAFLNECADAEECRIVRDYLDNFDTIEADLKIQAELTKRGPVQEFLYQVYRFMPENLKKSFLVRAIYKKANKKH